MLNNAFIALQDLVAVHQSAAITAVFLICFGESLALISLLLPLFSAIIALGALFSNVGGAALLLAWGAASAGAFGGYWVSYLVGYYFNDRIENLISAPKYRVLFEKSEASFKTWGIWAVLIGRFFKPLRTVVALAAGMSRLSPLQFQIANVVSAVSWTGFVLFSGAILAFLQRLLS